MQDAGRRVVLVKVSPDRNQEHGMLTAEQKAGAIGVACSSEATPLDSHTEQGHNTKTAVAKKFLASTLGQATWLRPSCEVQTAFSYQ